MRFTKWLIVLITVASFTFLMKMECGITEALKAKAPDFSLEDLNGNTLNLYEQKDNLILFFLTTRCPLCVAKIPTLNKTYAQLKSNGTEIWAIDVGEPEKKIRAFAEKHKIEFPVLLDYWQEAAQGYKILGVPTFIFIDKNKNIVFKGYDFPSNYLDIFSSQKENEDNPI